MNQSNERPRGGMGNAEKTVPTVVAEEVKNASVPIVLEASGSLMAKQRIELYAEVQGVFNGTAKEFKPGVRYRKGEVFLKMDADEQYATLQAQKSSLFNLIATSLPDLKIDYAEAFPRWEAYVKQFDLNKPVPELPEPSSTKERIFLSTKNIYTTFYNIKALEIRQQKYVLQAPFDGVLTEALVTPGTLVRAGQKLGEFISTNVFEMEISVGVSLMPFMRSGTKVEVRSLNEAEKAWQATVTRVNSRIDRNSQTGTIYLQLSGDDLEEGMYLEATVQAREEENAYRIDRKLLREGNRVFVVRDGKLVTLQVQPVFFEPQTVVIRGLPDGSQLLARTIPGMYEGMEVQVLQ